MGKLRPIGSEKLQGKQKLDRILEIARYKEYIPEPINESSSQEFSVVLSDGITYRIDREKNGYVIKKSINESSYDYLEPMKNRNYYRSYSQAFKRLNLIAKEVNTLTGNDSEISLFNEQKFVLKTPKPETPPMPAPMEAPSPEPSPEEPMGMDVPQPDSGPEEEPMDNPSDLEGDTPSDDMGMGETDGEVGTFKGVQKLTGKLTQKIRTLDDEELTSDNIKYIVNSILSSIDLNKLDDEDKEEIMGRFESDESMGMDMGDEGGEMSSSEDMSSDSELESSTPEEPLEMEFKEMADMNDLSDKIGSTYASQIPFESEVSEEDEFYSQITDSIFSESKVEKVLSKYFRINENERNLLKKRRLKEKSILERNKKHNITESKRLSVSEKQNSVAEEIIKKYPQSKVLGLTNKKNLVIEHKNSQIKITPKGDIL